MIPNSLKKMIIFPNEQRRKVLEAAIKDRAAISNGTDSYIVDQALASYLLPSNPTAAMWVELLYDGETLAESYARAFSFLAAGVAWEPSQKNGQPLADEFYRLVSYSTYRFCGNERELPHLIRQLREIANILPERDFCNYRNLLNRHLAELTQQNGDPDVFIQDIVAIFRGHPELLEHHTIAYRALMDIATIAAPTLRDTPALRVAYIDVLRQISKDW